NLNLDGWTVQDLMDKMDQNRLAVLGVATALVFLFLWVVEVFKPGGLTKNGRDVKALPATVWLFGAMVVFMAAHMAHQMIGTQEWITGPDPESIRGRGATDAATTVVLVVASAGIVYLLAKTAPKAALVPNVMGVPIGLLGLL